ncbi:MAG: hypothetical protein JNK76_03450 [Planctomycetales bacterium]|nr:hypothetical protein [Planctomycetales bacterium]MBN8625743.1 hypothetical protein [Planctomycetota bacterium]
MVSTGRTSERRFSDLPFTGSSEAQADAQARAEAAAREAAAAQERAKPREREPYEPLLDAAADWAAYASHYVGAQSDLLKMKFRRMLVLGIAWLFGRIALYVAIGYAMFLTLHGISGGIAELLGNRPWAGNLITGAICLGGLALAVSWGTKKFVRLNREQIEAHYQHRRKVKETATANERFGDGAHV